MQLTVFDHDRDVAGLRYVYPVVSRRAGGVSVGVNLNPNDACNFRCVYCQVPGLVFGKGPAIDLGRLEREFETLLTQVLDGSFLEHAVADASQRSIRDVAFSGNGEPTSSPQFRESIELVGRVLDRRGLRGTLPVVLITNGSLTHLPRVQAGLDALAGLGGEVWFKLDRATTAGGTWVNSSTLDIEQRRERLRSCAARCRTLLQTCLFAVDGAPPSANECDAYVEFVQTCREDGVEIEKVLLYGLARASHQPEAPRLSRLDADWLESFADRIRTTGIPVDVAP